MSITALPIDAIFNILVTVITLIARRFRFPSTIALIFAGLFAGFTQHFPLVNLGPDLFISILLPPIIFQETLQLDIDGLLDDSDLILSYSIIGTLIMMASIVFFSSRARETLKDIVLRLYYYMCHELGEAFF